MGKARLAIRAAMEHSERFSDGVAFVALATVDDLALVLPAVARAVDVAKLLQ